LTQTSCVGSFCRIDRKERPGILRGAFCFRAFSGKACPALDAGWNPIFRSKMRQRKKYRPVHSIGFAVSPAPLGAGDEGQRAEDFGYLKA